MHRENTKKICDIYTARLIREAGLLREDRKVRLLHKRFTDNDLRILLLNIPLGNIIERGCARDADVG